MQPLVHEVSELQITAGREQSEGLSPQTRTVLVLFPWLCCWSAGDRLLGQLDFWCGQMHSSSLTGFQVAQTNHSSLLNLQVHVVWRNAGLELSRNVKSKGKKYYLVAGFTEEAWKMRDSWHPGLTASWSLVLPSVQVSCIWCQLWMAQESSYAELPLSKSHSQSERSGCP